MNAARIRRPGPVLAGVLAVLLLAACGSSSDAGPSGDSAAPAATGSPAPAADATSGADAARTTSRSAFPVTLEHRYGSTTIEEQPERVVAVGLNEQDALLALGVEPVGVTAWLEAYPGEIGPWAEEALDGADLPTVLDSSDGIEFEKIASLQPDLILALYSDLSKQDYQRLGQIAPVVAQPPGVSDFGVSWQQETRVVGRAVGKPKEAEALVDEVEATFATARKEHPEFQGKSALEATPYEGFWVYGANDPRTRVLQELGFVMPSAVDRLIGDKYGANISLERVDLLDTDVIVWLVDGWAPGRKEVHQQKVYAHQPVVTEGREVFIDNASDFGQANSFVSVLSLPYTLDRLVPRLAAAVDGDPGTKVPGS